jgi:4-amino-4-deoxy-L-arabinose transferase-like glycosyltransferase
MSTTTLTPPATATAGVGRPSPPPGSGRRPGRFLRGRPQDPAWARPCLLALLAATGVLYLWGLGASGWANSYYSAAVQAGTQSWKAFLFGSLDGGNFITVDKSPAALWPMVVAARLFGVNAWSILVPQALMGVATVAVLHATVRRWFSPGAGLLAGAVLAFSPVAALIFRFNNPDALLVLLLTAAAYAMVRALETASARWLALAGALVGFGFLAKMLQALVVVPVFGLVYLAAAPTGLGRRMTQLAVAGAAVVASAGWWLAIVAAWPAGSRPYVGGSQDNTLWNLILGYNGFGRLTGDEPGSVGGGGAAGSRWGTTGWSRLFGAEMGGQISWLLPAALLLLVVGLALRGRAPRTDRARAALAMWGGWLVLTGAVFSYGKGIIHPYYTVALVPAIGALVGMGGASLWRLRSRLLARAGLAAALAVAAGWSYVLLARTPDWHPLLASLLLPAALVIAVALVAVGDRRTRGAVALAVAGAVVALSGSAAYALETAATPHIGAIPSAGPAGRGFGFGGGGGGGGGGAGPARQAGLAPGGGGAAAGGLLNGSAPGPELVSLLEADAGRYTWVAAVVGANQASGYQLGTGQPVMAIGGFNGTDPAPSLEQFRQYVAEGRIHYFVAGGGRGPGLGGAAATGTTAGAITAWVQTTYGSSTVGGVTVYDLTAPA